MARISTHVLDLEQGLPAAGIAVELYLGGALLGASKTNADGRTDAPLVSAERLEPGCYELLFHAGEYLKNRHAAPFFDDITIRFGVSDAAANYHVPLLLAAHGYSTYRGS
jgi:5-hydroxyisourate hydrolase